MPTFDGGELGTQVRFDPAGVFEFATQLRRLVFAFGQPAALFGQPSLEILGAPAKDFSLSGLRDQIALQFHDAVANIVDSAAFLSEFVGCGVCI
jgi:hypothetical protein